MTESAAAAAPAPTPDNLGAVIAHNLRQAEPAKPAPQAKAPPAAAPANDNAAPLDPGDEEMAALFEQEVAPEGEIDDELEQQADPLDEEVHGHKARAIIDAIKQGQLPAELLAQLKGVAKINGQEVQVSLAEALAGYQRMADYTNGKKEAKRLQREATERIASVRQMFENWNSADALIAGLRRLGKSEVFHQAAIAHARETWLDMKLQRENPEAYAARQEARREREEREKLQHQLRTQPDPRHEREVSALGERLQSLIFPAFTANGIKDTPFARKQFTENFQALYDEDADLEQVVEQAAKATAEQMADLAVSYQKTQQGDQARPANTNGAKPAGKPNPSPLPGRATGAPTTPARVRTRMNPSEMEDYLARKRRGIR